MWEPEIKTTKIPGTSYTVYYAESYCRIAIPGGGGRVVLCPSTFMLVAFFIVAGMDPSNILVGYFCFRPEQESIHRAA